MSFDFSFESSSVSENDLGNSSLFEDEVSITEPPKPVTEKTQAFIPTAPLIPRSRGKSIVLPPLGEPGPEAKSKSSSGVAVEKRLPIFFDLETIPRFEDEESFDLPDLPEQSPITPIEKMEVTVDDALKTVASIEETIAKHNPDDEWLAGAMQIENKEKKPRSGVIKAITNALNSRNAYEEAIAKRYKKMATSPFMCRIIGVGVKIGREEVHGYVAEEATDEEEAELISILWDFIANGGGALVGYNILSFDVRVLLVRSAQLGVLPPKRLNLNKYSSNDVMDVMLKLFPDNQWVGLKSVCKMLGIPIPVDDVDGSKVLDLWNDKEQRHRIGEYVKSDVQLVFEVYDHLNRYFW